MSQPSSAPPREHPLANILVNVLLPILALSYLGKDGDKFWHLGPAIGMAIAICLPLGYGLRDLVRTRKLNPFSVLGLASVLLTGGITLMVWNEDGTIHPKAAILFGIKEAVIPLILGLSFIVSMKMRTPLIRVFLLNDEIFDMKRVERAVESGGKTGEFRRLVWRATFGMAASFALATVLNFIVSYYFISQVDVTALDAREAYNDAVAAVTGWSFVIIGVPAFAMMMATLVYVVKAMEKITRLERDDFLMVGK
ncbi:VC0807 family protein [Sulfuriroseicoccus oceanibius]|uniref:MFS transporter n=1 Tax=Sulfuriroseicoccus oceanibius TaxID=2707525 RepID=A0A6B3L5Q3_9BACT|nr:VC0807 family protein [Sulfuriroseicoccus oceanibius]QQL45126.1 hypothetical protein G3M56_000635 [Sulfuriroseicoccus oceanibius]